MRTDNQTLQLMAAWLEDGRTQLPDHVLDAVLEQLPSKPQRRRWSPARRISDMSAFAKFAIATAAVLVVAIVGINVFGTPSGSGVGGVGASAPASPSPAPSSGSYRVAPTRGAIEPGRYRWLTDNVQVLFVLPDGWSGGDGAIFKNEDTATEASFAHNLPGSWLEVTHVYTDACQSEGALEPIGDSADDLIAALDSQRSTDAVVTDITSTWGPGKRVQITEAENVDRAQCRHGADGPLQIWADAVENAYYSFAPGSWGVVYVFDVDGERFVFNATYGPDVSQADVDQVEAIVESFEFTRH
jgi:hypothetical protein